MAAEPRADAAPVSDEGDEGEGGAPSEEDTEFDLRQFGIYQALPVAGEPDWGSEVLDADEYLRRVRFEAARCPRVVRADVDVRALEARRRQQEQAQAPGGGGAPQQGKGRPPHPLSAAAGERALRGEPPPVAPAWAVPGAAWVRQFVGDFEALRRRVADAYEAGDLATDAALPGANDRQGWDRLCFGRDDGEQPQAEGPGGGGGGGSSSSGGGDGSPGKGPEAGGGGGGAAAPGSEAVPGAETVPGSEAVPGSEITFLSPEILPVLMALDEVGVAALFQHHVAALRALPGLPLARAQWLFALSARIGKPLHAGGAAGFRALFARCAALRAGVGGPGDPLLPRANVLMAVAGAYFGQDPGMAEGIDTIELF